MMVTAFMIKIATFDLIPTHDLIKEMWYFPDGDAYSINFEQVGLESKLFLLNIGLELWIVVTHLLLILIHALVYLLKGRCGLSKNIQTKLGSYLYWNGLLRLYMEIFFDIAMLSVLNMYTVNWDTKFHAVQLSNIVSVLFLILVGTLPIIFLPLYCCKRK